MEHGIQFVDAARSIGPSIVSFSVLEPRVIGSGVVFDTQGHILTNHHILEGAESARVVFQDGREAVASVVGSDPKADLALVRVAPAAAELRPAMLGDSDRLQIGEWVLSCGSPPGARISVSVGVVSALGASGNAGLPEQADLIQTDATINAGNSGGPLVDRKGRVVGINTASAAHSGGPHSGLGFAIPINMAKQVAAELIAKASVGRGDISVD
jgi:S1-C subfamily serine protease